MSIQSFDVVVIGGGPGGYIAAIRAAWKPAPNRQLIEVDAHINDPAFAEVFENAQKPQAWVQMLV